MKINAVIPIRYVDCCNDRNDPIYVLDGKPLWDSTLQQAVDAVGIKKTVVAYDDDRFLSYLEKWQNKVEKYKRPDFLGLEGVTSLDVLAHVSEHTSADEQPDYWMLLEITHPLRPAGVIDQLVQAIRRQPADSLITVRPVHYNYWRREDTGRMVRISGSGDKMGGALYQEIVGICSLFSPKNLASGNYFGDHVDMVPISDFWSTIDVRDKDGYWLASKYLECENRDG